MRTWIRPISGGLTLLLVFLWGLGPMVSVLQASDFDEGFASYARGEMSLGEVEGRRKAQAAESAGRLRVASFATLDAPRSPIAAGPLEDETAASSETKNPVKRLADWVMAIPKRSARAIGGWKTDDFDEIEKHLDDAPVKPYVGNAAQREAESDIWRPIRVTAQAEANTIQGVAERIIAFNGVKALTGAGAGAAFSKTILAKSTKLLGTLSSAQKQALMKTASSGTLGQSLGAAVAGKASLLGRILKDKNGNNIYLTVLAAGLVSTFFNDGLDMGTLKDHLVSLDNVQSYRTVGENLVCTPLTAVAYYHMNNGASAVFNKIYNKAATSGALGGLLQGAERSVNALGASMAKTVSADKVVKAQQFAKSANALGLPGVGSATQMSLRGLLQSTFIGAAFGTGIYFAMDAIWRVCTGFADTVAIGGSRQKVYAKYDLWYTHVQRTGNRFRDAVEERMQAMESLVSDYRKFPMTRFLGNFMRFVGGYLGAVLASAIVVPTGPLAFGMAILTSAIVSEGGGAFGKWIGAKFDTREGKYARQLEKNTKNIFETAKKIDVAPESSKALLAKLAEIDEARRALGVRSKADLKKAQAENGPEYRKLAALSAEYDGMRKSHEARMADMAAARAKDYERLVKGSQVNYRIHFVRHLDDVQLVKKGDYVHMVISGDVGEAVDKKAMPKWDVIDARGHRGVWDYRSNKMVDVGKVSENNGNRILFIDGDQIGRDGEGALKNDDAGQVKVSTNGIVFEKSSDGEWSVKGYSGEYDVVCRHTGERYSWDGKRYVPAALKRKAEAAAAVVAAGTAPSEEEAQAPGLSAGEGRQKAPVLSALGDLARLSKTNGATSTLRLQRALFDGR